MAKGHGTKRPASASTSRAPAAASTSTSVNTPKRMKISKSIELKVPTTPTEHGVVMVSGQGEVGQLGLEDILVCKRFRYVPTMSNIVDVRAGGMHTVTMDKDGVIRTFGCNDEGALGRKVVNDDECVPKPVTLPAAAVAISAGDSHTAALLNNGDVYAWGSFRDAHGSMGLVIIDKKNVPCMEPTKIEVPEPAAAIASGNDHLVILTITHAVYTLGCGEQGQLGRLSQRSGQRYTRYGFAPLLTPTKVLLPSGASRIWAGNHATFALSANGEKMFAWGLNNYGQLGVAGTRRKCPLYAPCISEAFTAAASEWQEVACGQHHTLALDGTGQVYAIGRCEYGRLGLGDHGDALTLMPIPTLENCIHIAAGISTSMAITTQGDVKVWGMGSEYQLGTGKATDELVPTSCLYLHAPADANKALRISAGGQHSAILLEATVAQEPTATSVSIKEHTVAETEKTVPPLVPKKSHTVAEAEEPVPSTVQQKGRKVAETKELAPPALSKNRRKVAETKELAPPALSKNRRKVAETKELAPPALPKNRRKVAETKELAPPALSKNRRKVAETKELAPPALPKNRRKVAETKELAPPALTKNRRKVAEAKEPAPPATPKGARKVAEAKEPKKVPTRGRKVAETEEPVPSVVPSKGRNEDSEIQHMEVDELVEASNITVDQEPSPEGALEPSVPLVDSTNEADAATHSCTNAETAKTSDKANDDEITTTNDVAAEAEPAEMVPETSEVPDNEVSDVTMKPVAVKKAAATDNDAPMEVSSATDSVDQGPSEVREEPCVAEEASEESCEDIDAEMNSAPVASIQPTVSELATAVI